MTIRDVAGILLTTTFCCTVGLAQQPDAPTPAAAAEHFDPYFQQTGPLREGRFPPVITRAITQDREGKLWFATFGGPLRYDGEQFTNHGAQVGLARTRVFSLLEERSGAMWFGSITDGARRWLGDDVRRFTTAEGLPNDDVLFLFQDRDDCVWIATGGGLARWDGERMATFSTADGLAHDSVYSIAQGRDGRMWFGTEGGICWWDGKTFGDIDAKIGREFENVRAIAVAADGDVWFGGESGALRYDGEKVHSYTTAEGLHATFVGSLCIDKHGAVWFGHPGGFPAGEGGGATRYDGGTFTGFGLDAGFVQGFVYCIYQAKDGDIWFGSAGAGVRRYDGERFRD